MNIDWNKAPEWANAVVAASAGTLYFVEDFGVRSKRQAVSNSYACGLAADMTIKSHLWKLIEERPKKQEAWDGEGLPPVGMDIECTFDSWGYWRKGRVLYYGKQMIFMEQYGESPDCRKFEGSMNPDGIKFRPVRTAEQVAAEERDKAIEEMIRTTSDGITCMDRYDAEQLYKAGYRKQ